MGWSMVNRRDCEGEFVINDGLAYASGYYCSGRTRQHHLGQSGVNSVRIGAFRVRFGLSEGLNKVCVVWRITLSLSEDAD